MLNAIERIVPLFLENMFQSTNTEYEVVLHDPSKVFELNEFIKNKLNYILINFKFYNNLPDETKLQSIDLILDNIKTNLVPLIAFGKQFIYDLLINLQNENGNPLNNFALKRILNPGTIANLINNIDLNLWLMKR